VEVRLSVKKMLLPVGVLSLPKLSKDEIDDGDCVCKKCLLKKYRKKLLKTDEIKKDLFEEEYRYQWKNRH